MPEPGGILKVRHVADVTLVDVPAGKLVHQGDVDRVCAEMDQIINGSGRPHIVLNLDGVAHMSSIFMGRLMAFHRRAVQKQGRLRLCCVQPQIREALTLAQMTRHIPIYPSAREALLGHSPAWYMTILFAIASAVMGLFAAARVTAAGLPPGAAAAAVIYFIASIGLPPLVYLGRWRFAGLHAVVQWLIAGAVAALWFAAFLLLIQPG